MPTQKPFRGNALERYKSKLVGYVNAGINTAANYVWTGLHTFQALLTTRDLVPETSDTYDVGSVDKRYKTMRVAELRATLFSKDEVMILGNKLVIAKDQGTLAADVADTDTTIDFGVTMTPSDWIMIQAEDSVTGNPSLEWMLVGSNVSGTVYNVTRNVDGSGANDWAAGTPFLVIGQDGDFRIELTAGSSVSIKIIRQGSAWNSSQVTVETSDVGMIFTGNNASDDANMQTFKNAAGDIVGYIGVDNSAGSLLSLLPVSGKNVYIGRAPSASASGSNLIAKYNDYIQLLATGSNGHDVMDVGIYNEFGSYTGGANNPQGRNVSIRNTYTGTTLDVPVFHHSVLAPYLSYPGVQACWTGRGYDGTGSTLIVPDRTGMGHHLSISGGAAPATVQYGNAPDITYTQLTAASSQYLFRANESVFNYTNSIRFMAFIYFGSLPTAGNAMSIAKNGDTTESWQLFVNNTAGTIRFNLRVYDSGGTPTTLTPAVTPSSATWYSILGFINIGGSQGIYINEASYSTTAPASLRAPSGNFTIGSSGGTSFMNGRVAYPTYAIENSGVENYLAIFQSNRDYFGI